MKEKNEIIIERIKIEMERTKLYIYTVIALTAGEYALFMNIKKYSAIYMLFLLGLIFLMTLIFAIIASYIKIETLFNRLNNGTRNDNL